ncbi:peptide chain release factor N(5)-glutamine methyltransferase [uncultured Actinomyces sp.]|uniref:peptide chain release factor N(5)-glutamine methyltransferase n=1 Tax=uncultured Actinomyces sp. TaxID=249061 RepID=UPI002610CFD9|nr:peptide chain release factor N(5)-glutamine methyltransferase [uncultured Actinomyces sp.]
MDPLTLFREGIQTLAQAGVESAQADARAIFEAVLGAPIYMWPREIEPDDAREIEALIARRASREPLQHVLGKMWFYGLELEAGPGVFCVRPETEVLAKWAIDAIAGEAAVVLDACTGSGALALAIAANTPASVVALEKSQAACVAAHANAQALGLEMQVVQGDALVFNPQWEAKFDLVISNPPYVPPRQLAPELDFDPPEALWGGGDDGLDFVRGLVPVIYQYLKPGGRFGMEHDDTQGKAAFEIARNAGFVHVRTLADLNERPRFVVAQKPLGECR